MLTLYEAIKYSCNTFFYQLGLKVGAQRIADMATEFGLGSSTGSGLLGEKPGIVPSPAWKRKLLRERWHPGDTVSFSIGQGLITVTPLQVARLMAAVANGGTLWKPRLVSRIEAADGSTVKAEEPIVQRRIALAPVIYNFLRRALWGVVNDGGTGRAAGIQGIDVAGKTGTAQTREVRSAADRRAWRDDHAWFAGFAPAEDPRVVLVVLVERAGPGGREAAPLARDVFRAIFLERIAAVSPRD